MSEVREKKAILIPEDISDKGKIFLQEQGYELIIGGGTTEKELVHNVVTVDAILIRNATYSRRVMEAGERLKVIGRHGTGIDNIDLDAAGELGIWVVNSPEANINAVAEHTIAFIAALGTNLLQSDHYTRAQDWSYRLNSRRFDLNERVLGLIGFGRIGQAVAQKAIHGLGMKVCAYNPGFKGEVPKGVVMADTVEEVFRTADYLSLHVPSTSETRGMVNQSTIALMKPTAFLINCARGDVCVEEDLCHALLEKRIAGAALDVFQQEPLKDSLLLTMENVILTQHHAGITQDSLDKMGYDAAVGIHDVLSGKIPQWPVNRPVNARVKTR